MPVFFVLGSMEIQAGSRVLRPQGRMIQVLFASLLAERDRFVRADVLAEELWGGTPPAKSDNALQAQVSRLRRLLSQAEPDTGAQRLTANASGYRLSVQWAELDVAIFQHKVDLIRGRPIVEPRRDAADLREALALWRGPVFGGLIGGPIGETAAIKYEESRTAALEYLYELELAADGHTRIIPELTELVLRHPLRERFCSLLMVALYRSGRQTDALDAYRSLKRRLDEDLGIEPSPVMRRYEHAILKHDPVLMSLRQDPVLMSLQRDSA
jgi:DNA-binding SARP family transcriptional activator